MSEREELAQELDGVIADCEKGNGFDDVCLRTIKRVRDALSAQPQGEPVAAWMRDLKPDWDSYGARRISEDAIAIASEIHAALMSKWQIVPVATGGVQIELHAAGIDIEIEINPDCTVEVFAEPSAAIPQAGEFVAVRRATLENWSRYGNIAEIWFEINGVLAAATGKESE